MAYKIGTDLTSGKAGGAAIIDDSIVAHGNATVKAMLDNLGTGQVKIAIVESLPSPGVTDTIYLVRATEGEVLQDYYNQYIYINGVATWIGTTKTYLSGVLDRSMLASGSDLKLENGLLKVPGVSDLASYRQKVVVLTDPPKEDDNTTITNKNLARDTYVNMGEYDGSTMSIKVYKNGFEFDLLFKAKNAFSTMIVKGGNIVGEIMTPEAGKTYIISILNGVFVMAECPDNETPLPAETTTNNA